MSASPANRRPGRVTRIPSVVMLVSLAVVAVATGPAAGRTPRRAQPRPAVSAIVGDAAGPVANHAAVPLRRHRADAALSLNVGLAVRHSAELDAVIRAASTPGSPDDGHYLTPAQYDARYAPTDADVAAVRDWLTARGVRVTGVTPDNLMVSATATTATVERAFAVSVNDYRAGTRTFFSNAAAPTVPADLGIHWVSGLNDFDVPKSFAEPSPTPAFRSGGYFPGDFRKAYNVDTVPLVPPGLANDESIGLTLWGAPLVQSDLNSFTTNTGAQPLTINQVGPDGIDFIPCSTSSCTAVSPSSDTSPWDETAMDVEHSHGIAPGTHLKYWLGSTSNQGGSLQPDLAAVEHAVNAAANDSTVNVVSNSWGFGADVFDPNIDASLQHAASVGKTFFFSSGDSPTISYPATSPYVVAVGGTNLNLNGSSVYVGETTWSSSGFGCSTVFTRPTWQTDLGSQALPCSGRIEPDVAADADPGTGAYVFFGGGHQQVGGTSLSAPLWAGMTAVWNEANLQASQPGVGFAAPLLYSLGANSAAAAFHDVAPTGWDQRTGWGSPKLATMIADAFNETPTTTSLHASRNPVAYGGTVVFTAIVSPTPTGGWVTFRKNASSASGCFQVTIVSGRASCSMRFSPPGTYHVQAQYGGNAAFAGSASNVVAERADPPPAPPAGYWMAGQSGAVYAFGAAKYHGNASTTGVTHFEPTPSRAGYWIVNRAGQVFAFGDAHGFGNATGLVAGETVSSLSSTPTGKGYWLFTSRGRALRFGDARSFGDLSGRALNKPVIGSVATPTGHGYYMVASDGGIFAFGDAGFFGSTGGIHLNKPVNGLVPTATNRGYWMVASDGGIFAFGDARFRGSMGGTRLNKPVVGMVRYGNGYLMVGSDGGIFDFSDQPFLGSLAGKPLAAPIVSVAS